MVVGKTRELIDECVVHRDHRLYIPEITILNSNCFYLLNKLA